MQPRLRKLGGGRFCWVVCGYSQIRNGVGHDPGYR